MKNFVNGGWTVRVPAQASVKSGDLVVVGELFGVAYHDAEPGDPVEINTEGVFTLPKTSAQAWTVGAAVYWDSENKAVTTTAGDNVPIGHAVEAAANPSATGVVRLSI